MNRPRTSSESDLDGVDPGFLLVVSGASGTGKSSLCKRAISEMANLRFSVSYTTRPRRKGERNGEDYFFVEREVFEDLRERGLLAEWAEVHGNLYGTSMEFVQAQTESGVTLILDIDTQGAQQIREKYDNAVFLFVLPPSYEELRNRLVGRATDSEGVIERRLAHADGEIAQCVWYKYIIMNDHFEVALEKFKAVIRAETCKRTRMDRTIQKFVKLDGAT